MLLGASPRWCCSSGSPRRASYPRTLLANALRVSAGRQADHSPTPRSATGYTGHRALINSDGLALGNRSDLERLSPALPNGQGALLYPLLPSDGSASLPTPRDLPREHVGDATGVGADCLSRGDGQDTIEGSGRGAADVETVRFKPGLLMADVMFIRAGSNLVARIRGTADTLTVVDAYGANPISSFVFDDGEFAGMAALLTICRSAIVRMYPPKNQLAT